MLKEFLEEFLKECLNELLQGSLRGKCFICIFDMGGDGGWGLENFRQPDMGMGGWGFGRLEKGFPPLPLLPGI